MSRLNENRYFSVLTYFEYESVHYRGCIYLHISRSTVLETLCRCAHNPTSAPHTFRDRLLHASRSFCVTRSTKSLYFLPVNRSYGCNCWCPCWEDPQSGCHIRQTCQCLRMSPPALQHASFVHISTSGNTWLWRTARPSMRLKYYTKFCSNASPLNKFRTDLYALQRIFWDFFYKMLYL